MFLVLDFIILIKGQFYYISWTFVQQYSKTIQVIVNCDQKYKIKGFIVDQVQLTFQNP
jgi:hypothetical protein